MNAKLVDPLYQRMDSLSQKSLGLSTYR